MEIVFEMNVIDGLCAINDSDQQQYEHMLYS